jgi:hypothetical protein
MKRMLMTFVVVAAGFGCSYGMKARNFAPANSPRGVVGLVSVGSAQFEAELIEARDTALLVLVNPNAAVASAGSPESAPRLRLVPFAQIRSAVFRQTHLAVADGKTPSAKALESLRLLSRFPQGVSPALLETLLRAYSQTQLEGTPP